jgi:hypothetical protein
MSGDPRRDPPSTEFGGEARAGQTSTSTGGSTGGEGTMTPSYEGEDAFLGDGVASSGQGDRAPGVEDVGGGPSMRIDGGRNPNPEAGGDDLARSHDGRDDDSVRTAEQSRNTDDRRP